MKKYIKIIFPIILLFVLLIVHFTHIGANSQTIGPIKKGNLLKYNGSDSLYFKYYTLGNNTDVAAFSTLFQAPNISTGQCELTNNWSEGIKAGIATIIKKAQEDNSNLNTAESKEYYYAELAINEFIYNMQLQEGTPNTKNRISQSISRPVSEILGNYYNYYEAAVLTYDKVMKSNKEHLNIVSDIGNPRTEYFYDANTTSEVSAIYEIYNEDLDNLQVSLQRGANQIPVGIKIEGYTSDDPNSFTSVPTAIITRSSNTEQSLDLSNGKKYVKIVIKDERDDKSNIYTIRPKLVAEGTMIYDTASNYNCGTNNQTLTPNSLEQKTENYNDIIVMKVTNGKSVVDDREDYCREYLKIVNKEKDTNTPLSDAEFTITKYVNQSMNQQKQSKITVKTNNNGEYIYEFKESGYYCITETKASDGYLVDENVYCMKVDYQNDPDACPFSVAYNSNGEIDNDNYNTVLTIENDPYKIYLKKTNTSGTNIPDAQLILTQYPATNEPYVHNNEPLSWNTSDEPIKEVSKLSPGTYFLKEINPPSGYTINYDPVRIIVSNKHTNTIHNGNQNMDRNFNYSITNNSTSIVFRKVDSSNQSIKLRGAQLQILDENQNEIKDSNNNVLYTWTSGEPNDDKLITGLPVGTYYLVENNAPSGYSIKEPIKFSIELNGTISINNETLDSQILLISNDKNQLRIKKIDTETNQSLAGTHLQILDETGTEVIKVSVTESDEANMVTPNTSGKNFWITNDKDYIISGLPIGTYRIRELHAPDGYKLLKNDLVFTVSQDGTIVINDEEVENSLIIVENGKNQFKVSKIDITGNKEVPNALLTIYDNSTNEVAKTVDGIELSWTTGEEPYIIKGLKAGTYRLVETQSPSGYVINTEEIVFTIDHQGNVKVNNKIQDSNTLIMTTEQIIKEIYISQQDINNKGSELAGATLVLINSDGEEIERWVTTTEPRQFANLAPGTYTIKAISAPDGYQFNKESVTFTIDKNGLLNGETIIYSTPLTDVPNTLSTQSIIIIVFGAILIGSGIGMYIYGIKKKKEI